MARLRPGCKNPTHGRVGFAWAKWSGYSQFQESGELALAKWKPFWQQWAVAFLVYMFPFALPGIGLLRDSTLGHVVSFTELLLQADTLADNTKRLLQALLVVSLICVAINFAPTRLAMAPEVRLRRSSRGGTAAAAPDEMDWRSPRPGPDPAA